MIVAIHPDFWDAADGPRANSSSPKYADILQRAGHEVRWVDIYKSDILPNLSKGKTLLFSHGLSVHFGLIKLPKDIDCIMVAPKGPGHMVRRLYAEGKGMPALIAVAQDKSKTAKKTALAWAKGIGSTRAGVLQTTFKEETETDLFGEQAVLCGGASALVQAGFETLVEAGYQPEIAYYECLHELKLIVDLIYEGGLSYMRYSVSDTAEYGDYTRGPRVVNDQTRAEMKKILSEIQKGEFAREWMNENKSGRGKFLAMRKSQEDQTIERVGAELRKMMPFLKKRKEAGIPQA